MDYGTGAIFGCLHDQRDFEFAKYNLEILKVVSDGSENKNFKEAYTGEEKLLILIL